MKRIRWPIGPALRQFRTSAGLSQQELADRAGMSIRAVRDMEQGRVRRPHSRSVDALAGALALEREQYEELQAVIERDGGRLQISILGPLSVRHSASLVTAPSRPMLRLLLALLALHAGQAVGRDEIVDTLWGERPPRTCRNLIHVYIAQLRSSLEAGQDHSSGTATIEFTEGGYRLSLEEEAIDILRFHRLSDRADRARCNGDLAAARELAEQALACWRDTILEDCGAAVRHHPSAIAATQRRIRTTMTFADLSLAAGQAPAAVDRLRHLVPHEPFHEGLHARLMLALAGSGEQASALLLYRTMAERLVEQLGVDPGPELQQAHLAVLTPRSMDRPWQHLGARPAPPNAGRQLDRAAVLTHPRQTESSRAV